MRTMLDANQIRLSHFAWRSRIARSSVLVRILLAILGVGGVGHRAPCNHTIQYPVSGDRGNARASVFSQFVGL